MDEKLIGLGGLHERLGDCHPKLRRGQVWCRSCGYTETVSSAFALKHSWPKHCGCTMTIDAPGEQTSATLTKDTSHQHPHAASAA